jgi:hypothetical protein
MGSPPDLSSLNRLDLSIAMLLANLMQPPGQQQVHMVAVMQQHNQATVNARVPVVDDATAAVCPGCEM